MAYTMAEAKKCGFTPQHHETFKSKEGIEEEFHVWFHEKKGVLLLLESYNKKRLNRAHLYFNARIKNPFLGHMPGCSGIAELPPNTTDQSWRYRTLKTAEQDNLVYVGDRDVRGGIKMAIEEIEDRGELMPQWWKKPYLWLVNYAEESKAPKQSDRNSTADYYDKIIDARFARLPQRIQDAMNGVHFQEWLRKHPPQGSFHPIDF